MLGILTGAVSAAGSAFNFFGQKEAAKDAKEQAEQQALASAIAQRDSAEMTRNLIVIAVVAAATAMVATLAYKLVK